MQFLRESVQSTLKRSGIYQRVKASSVYDLYWKVADRRLIDNRNREVDFYRNLLARSQRGSLIFDVGANAGDKTDVFLRLGARVVAVELDERCQEILRGKFLEYRLAPKPVVIVGKAVSDGIRNETMWIDGPASAVNTLSKKWVETLKTAKGSFEHGHCGLDFARSKTVETTTLEELIRAHGLPFFVKIDVEGHEASVIRGLKHPVQFLSFEINLPEFEQEGLECVKLLNGLLADGKFNYATDLQCGMALEKWLSAQEFSKVLEQCSDGSIEVFWRTPLAERK
jgi:FkbM family methyltransferase